MKRKLIFNDKINQDLIDDYVAIKYHIKFKDGYKRESETELDTKKPSKFLRFVNAKDENHNDFLTHYELSETERFIIFPSFCRKTQKDRAMVYLSGSSGAGKTFVVNQYCELYKKIKKENQIYFLSKNNWRIDESLNHDIYNFVDVDKFIEYYTEEENVKEFEQTLEYNNSLFVFDDIGSLSHNSKKVMWRIINIILEYKRKNLISCVIISHENTMGHDTKKLIPEIKNYLIFPRNLQVKSNRLLTNYLGLSKQDIQEITDSYDTTLWVSIDTQRRLVISQHEFYFL